MIAMGKKKTSMNIDETLWKEWLIFVTQKYGTSRKVSEELEKAIREYMDLHKEGK
jgi:hypothetical protein